MKIQRTIKITDDLVKEFSELTGDKNPIHLDDDFAKKSIFGKRVAHGMLVSSFFSKIIAEDFLGHGSIYLNQTLNFIKPCYIGDVLLYKINLIKKEKNKYTLSTRVYNKDKEIILDGTALILVK